MYVDGFCIVDILHCFDLSYYYVDVAVVQNYSCVVAKKNRQENKHGLMNKGSYIQL